jgi:hypothetical protein
MSDPTIERWASDTWLSFVAMAGATGLPADSIRADLAPGTRSGYTSPTNVGGYLWSTVAARDLGLVEADECAARCARTVATVAALERHPGSGMFFNWYDDETGATLRRSPEGTAPLVPFLSSVDNGWLAAGLMVVSEAVPATRDLALEVLDGMDFAAFHDADAGRPGPGGRLRGGFWVSDPGQETTLATYAVAMEPAHQTTHHYDQLNSEPRITSYVGIARGQLPPEHLTGFDLDRRDYRGRSVVPTYGGSMFEALMPDLLVPEEDWGRESWARNHRDTVALQREYALDERGWAAWGFSPSARPTEGYREFGVPPIAWLPGGYSPELDGPNGPEPVVTPHASAMALLHEPEAAQANLEVLEGLGCYGPGGFVDSIGLSSRRTAERYLSLDQSMVMAALAHRLGAPLRRWFATAEVEEALGPPTESLTFPT